MSQGYLDEVWAAIERDDLPEAKRLALEAYSIAQSDRDRAHAAYVVAESMNRLGEWSEATTWWQRTIDAKDKLDYQTCFSPLKSGITYFNAGLSHRLQGDLLTAEAMYKKALMVFVEDGQRAYTLTALLNLAWLDCFSSDTKQAPVYLAMAHGLADTQEDRYDLMLGEAFIKTKLNEHSAAVDLCRCLLDNAETPAFVQAQAAWVSALAHENLDGDYDAANRMLALAESIAGTLKPNERIHVMHEVERLRRRVAKAG